MFTLRPLVAIRMQNQKEKDALLDISFLQGADRTLTAA